MAKWLKGSMFQRTQRKLTLQYSALLILFLILFVVIVYGLLYYAIFKDEKVRLGILIRSETEFIQTILEENKSEQISSKLFLLSTEQFFYYWLDNQGKFVMGDEVQPEIRWQVLSWIEKNGSTANDQVVTVPLEISIQPPKEGGISDSVPQEADFLVTSRPIYVDGVLVGSLYIGKDFSHTTIFFDWLIRVLSGIVLSFFLLALFISYLMSHRALIPVSEVYFRQREFLADASHELRTPLSVMLSSIELLRMEVQIEENGFVSNLLDDMKDEVKRMTRLVAELLSLARSDSDEVTLNLIWFDFRPVAEKAVRSLMPIASDNKVLLQMEMQKKLLVYGDIQWLTQLLVILIDNAIKYTSAGGSVEVKVRKDQRKQNQFLTIVVKDTGIGIHAKDQERIFDRFYRQDRSRSKIVLGHGLGLSIAKWIVRLSDGTINVDSTLGKGSTFTVQIPVPDEPSDRY
ncbi:sensor histidine kinase [Paenibacillus agricola]|uniref:histidine kinase n=1 Tax=Paenibacillus agricola TaxID=2716264 RepID=A0ABX0JDN2_9BACL|nr:HAMP domain-containing sensor histidine kinase [Paenibacillus agricola]NHN32818.1 HAMP domain-containing histidine kinase [Paenibacillus agricola]